MIEGLDDPEGSGANLTPGPCPDRAVPNKFGGEAVNSVAIVGYVIGGLVPGPFRAERAQWDRSAEMFCPVKRTVLVAR